MKKSSKRSSPNSNARQPDPFLEVGRFIRPHGVRGQLILQSDAGYISTLPAGSRLYTGADQKLLLLETIRAHQGRYLVTLQGYHTREQADSLRNTLVYMDTSELPELEEGEYFYWQLIGLRVETVDGMVLGTVREILETGANDVYVLETAAQGDLLIPAIQDVIQKIDLDQGLIQINILPGLLPDETIPPGD